MSRARTGHRHSKMDGKAPTGEPIKPGKVIRKRTEKQEAAARNAAKPSPLMDTPRDKWSNDESWASRVKKED